MVVVLKFMPAIFSPSGNKENIEITVKSVSVVEIDKMKKERIIVWLVGCWG